MGAREMDIEAKTIEDALTIAEKAFGVDKSQIEVEVLDRGQPGFLGILERPVMIRATILRPDEDDVDTGEDQTGETTCDGTVEIRDGKLYIQDPVGSGNPAIIIPTSEVILTVNDSIVTEPKPVTEKDKVEISLTKRVYPADITIEVSEDCLTAYVKVTPEITVNKKLEDQAPQSILELKVLCHEERVNTVTASEIEENLKSKGVVFGLNYNAIKQAAEKADGMPEVVAVGKPVQQGKNGFIEYLFQSDPVEIAYDENERIDYWERYIFPSVKEGDVLAVLHPPTPGIPGIKITGEEIPPDPVFDDVLRAKEGVRISDDGRQAIATMAGRPVKEDGNTPYLKITQLMTHSGDVNLSTGNLRFWGDLLILGNVTGGMEVSALGDITIKGNVAGAIIRAGSRVICQGNVIKSQIYSGGLIALYDKLASLVGDLEKLMDQIIRETDEIHRHLINTKKLELQPDGHTENNVINRIISLVIKQKKKPINAFIEECTTVLDTAILPFPPVIEELLQSVKDLIGSPKDQARLSLDILKGILEKSRGVNELLVSLPDRNNDIVCKYVQNSVLETTGSIQITDKGGFYSTLTAEGDISVHGVFRGGEILAKGDVLVNEAGSPGPSSGDVKIKVSEGSTIKIRKGFPETILQVGNRFHILKKEEKALKVHLGTEGNIDLGTFRT